MDRQQIQNSQQQYFIQQHQLTSNPGNSSPHTMGMMSQMVPNASLNTMKSPMAQQQQIMQQQGKNIFLKFIIFLGRPVFQQNNSESAMVTDGQKIVQKQATGAETPLLVNLLR